MEYSEELVDLIYKYLTDKGNLYEMLARFQNERGCSLSSEYGSLFLKHKFKFGEYVDGYITVINNKEYTFRLTKTDIVNYLNSDFSDLNDYLYQKYDVKIKRSHRVMTVSAASALILVAAGALFLLKPMSSDKIGVPAEGTVFSEAPRESPSKTQKSKKTQKPKKTETEAEMERVTEAAVTEQQYGAVNIEFRFIIEDEAEAELISTLDPYRLYLDDELMSGEIVPNDVTNFTGDLEAGEHTICVKSGSKASKKFTVTVDPDAEINEFLFDLEKGVISPYLTWR